MIALLELPYANASLLPVAHLILPLPIAQHPLGPMMKLLWLLWLSSRSFAILLSAQIDSS